ncbi:MAG: hypothetical protein IKS29_06205 [Oscillospiraceae bacterium]|nr:hypothetical protein [Oscillospiraceae bacterium]
MAYDKEKERQEAIAAGRQALSSLRQAKECLASARSWGVYDIVAGGLISSLVKHSRMEQAQQDITEARRTLRRFEKELRDTDAFAGIDIHLETQDFLGVADVLFDGILADAAMQSRIHAAQQELDRAIQQVEQILRQL